MKTIQGLASAVLTSLLLIASACPALGEHVTVCLSILDHDDLRGALRPDSRGRTERGDLPALRRLLESP